MVDGWLIFISAITTVLGFEISYEAIAHLHKVGFSDFSEIAGLMAAIISISGWLIWWKQQENRLHQMTLLGAGILGLLTGILRGSSGRATAGWSSDRIPPYSRHWGSMEMVRVRHPLHWFCCWSRLLCVA